MIWLMNALYALALLVGWPYLIYRRLTRGPSNLSLAEHLGRMPPRPVAAHCIWVHGVSLGEINAARTLVAELHQRSPNTVVVVSSTTQTGLARARQLFHRNLVFRFPLDFSFAVRTALRRVRPSAIVLMELEVWPNLLAIAAREEIPVLIANGRVTAEKSMRRFSHPLLRGLARRMFSQISWIGAQDETYAERFRRLGAPPERVVVTGSLKYDAAEIAARVAGDDKLAAEMGIALDRPLWVCGSTGPGEESVCLAAYRALLAEFPTLQLALIPRKPERFNEVAAEITRQGFACLRRSSGAPQLPPDAQAATPVFLGDTMGELRLFYSLADLVFVGRTLVPLGGSDVMEVAGLAKAMVVGPSTFNFAEAVELLAGDGALLRLKAPLLETTPDAAAEARLELVRAVGELLRAPERRAAMGAGAQQAIAARRGATATTVEAILRFVGD